MAGGDGHPAGARRGRVDGHAGHECGAEGRGGEGMTGATAVSCEGRPRAPHRVAGLQPHAASSGSERGPDGCPGMRMPAPPRAGVNRFSRWPHRRLRDAGYRARPVTEFVALPPTGRRFSSVRRVRLGDASPAGRLRLDAIARYLQDVAADDAADAAVDGEGTWVVRRTALLVSHPLVLGEQVSLTTWCGGTGSRWADRRTTLRGDRGGAVEASSLWVHIDPVSGRPRLLPPDFATCYAEAAGGRVVRARLHHPDPPSGAVAAPWPLRVTDFDALGHVNNAIAWAALEGALAPRRDLRWPLLAEVEHHTSLDPGAEPGMVIADHGDGARHMWLLDGGTVAVSALARRPSG